MIDRIEEPGWRDVARRIRQLARRLEDRPPAPPFPPPLPPGRTVAVAGRGEMFHRDAPAGGDGPPVLLLHGWTSTADLTWWRVYGRLTDVGRVIAPDHRGHGRGIRTELPFTLEDAADDAAALLRTLGTGPAIVCGYSMGGPMALLLWQRHPALVAGLVLEATALEWQESRWERWLWRSMVLVERVMRSAKSKSVIDRLLRELVERCPELEPHRGWMEGELRRGDPEAIAEAGRAIGRFDARAFAGEIDVPTAVVVTLRDRSVRPRKQRALVDAIPGAVRFDLDADHDACLASVEEFPATTLVAVRQVAEAVATSTRRSA